MVALSPTQLLSFERQGYVRTPGLLAESEVRSLAPVLRGLFDERRAAAAEQKVRVVCGEAALRSARLVAGSSRAALLRECEARLADLPGGSVPFFQLFNLWGESERVNRLVRSSALAGTAAALLGVGAAGRPSRLRLYQDSLFVKRPGDGPTNWHSDLAMV